MKFSENLHVVMMHNFDFLHYFVWAFLVAKGDKAFLMVILTPKERLQHIMSFTKNPSILMVKKLPIVIFVWALFGDWRPNSLFNGYFDPQGAASAQHVLNHYKVGFLPFSFPSPSLLPFPSPSRQSNLLILNISAKSSPIFTKFWGKLPLGILQWLKQKNNENINKQTNKQTNKHFLV